MCGVGENQKKSQKRERKQNTFLHPFAKDAIRKSHNRESEKVSKRMMLACVLFVLEWSEWVSEWIVASTFESWWEARCHFCATHAPTQRADDRFWWMMEKCQQRPNVRVCISMKQYSRVRLYENEMRFIKYTQCFCIFFWNSNKN